MQKCPWLVASDSTIVPGRRVSARAAEGAFSGSSVMVDSLSSKFVDDFPRAYEHG